MNTSTSDVLPVTVHSPRSAVMRPMELLRGLFADLRASRSLAWSLATRDLRAQYRQSYLGYLWAFIMPLGNTLVWILLHKSGVVQVADTGIPYPVYVFTGTMFWQTLVESVQTPLQQVVGARSMLSKLNFPREALIMSGVIKQLFSAAVKLGIMIPAVLILGVVPDLRILLVPVALIVLVMTGTSVGLLISPVGMLYTDVARVVPLVSQFAMYITPVVFAMPKEGVLAQVFRLNPGTPLLLTARSWLTGTETIMFGYFLGVAITAAVLLLVGALLYRITMPILIERINA